MDAVISLAISVAAAVIANRLNKLLDRPEIQASLKQMATKAAIAGNKNLSKWLRFFLTLFAFWFLIDQLMGLAMSKAPITRVDMVMTAFWMCWLVALFIRVVLRRGE